MDKQDFVKNSLSPKSLSNDLATNDIKSELDNQLVETTIVLSLNDAPHKDRPNFSDNKKHQKKLEQKKLSQALRDNLLRRKKDNKA